MTTNTTNTTNITQPETTPDTFAPGILAPLHESDFGTAMSAPTGGVKTSATQTSNTAEYRKQTLSKDELLNKIYNTFNEFSNAYVGEWARLERCDKLYRCTHWEDIPVKDRNEPRPVTPVIQSTIENVRAELAQWFPDAIITADDVKYKHTAELLTKIVRENHVCCDYESEYEKLVYDLLVGGYMIHEVGFDPDLNCGLGGCFLRYVDNRSIMLDPNAVRVEDCRAIIKFASHPMSWFAEHYPNSVGKMKNDEITLRMLGDNTLRQSFDDECVLIEYWWREYDSEVGRYRVHMAKAAGRVLLEDSREIMSLGMYNHGAYPFIVTPMFIRKGCCLGFGFCDMFESQQILTDKLDQIVMKNALMASHNKMLINSSSGFDINDLSDWTRDVHRGDNINGVRWFTTPPLPGYMIDYVKDARDSIREESGANDFSRGTTFGGVTAASAIIALQEMSNKRAQMLAKSVHRAFAAAVRLELEVERQFAIFNRRVYLNDNEELIEPSALMTDDGMPIEFKVSVKVQKENRFSILSHNETISNMVRLGMLAPQVALEMFIFDGKEEAIAKMQDYMAKTGNQGEKPKPPEGESKA